MLNKSVKFFFITDKEERMFKMKMQRARLNNQGALRFYSFLRRILKARFLTDSLLANMVRDLEIHAENLYFLNEKNKIINSDGIFFRRFFVDDYLTKSGKIENFIMKEKDFYFLEYGA